LRTPLKGEKKITLNNFTLAGKKELEKSSLLDYLASLAFLEYYNIIEANQYTYVEWTLIRKEMVGILEEIEMIITEGEVQG
jgi:hypothetical protein